MKTISLLLPLSLAADPPCVPHVPGHHGLHQGRDGEDQQTGYGADLPSAGKLGGVQPDHPVEVILSDWERKEVEEMIEKLLGGKEGVEEYETAKYSNATNNDAPDAEKFEIKAEGEAEIIIITPNSMDEEVKDSTICDDDATKSDVCDGKILK